MDVTKKDIRKISKEFRVLAGQSIHALYQAANQRLKSLIDFIDATPLLVDYIQTLDSSNVNIASDIEQLDYNSIFEPGSTREEQIAYYYALLHYVVDNKIEIYHVTSGYSSSSKLQDRVRAFGQNVVFHFVELLELYLSDIVTDMGFDMDENNQFSISINGHGAQVNISQGNSSISAIQSNATDYSELVKIIESIEKKIPIEMPSDAKVEIIENAKAIRKELTRSEPRKGLMKSFALGIQSLANRAKYSVEFIAAVTALVQFFNS